MENKLFEGTDLLNAALSIVMTNVRVMVASARSVGWRRNEVVTILYLIYYTSGLMYSMQTHGSETFLINTNGQNLH